MLEGVGRDFFFTDDDTRRHFSYFSGTFREDNRAIENQCKGRLSNRIKNAYSNLIRHERRIKKSVRSEMVSVNQ